MTTDHVTVIRCVRDTNSGDRSEQKRVANKCIEDLPRKCVIYVLEKIETVKIEVTTERMETGASPDMNVLKFDVWNVIPLT